jgi:hypothetical protein
MNARSLRRQAPCPPGEDSRQASSRRELNPAPWISNQGRPLAPSRVVPEFRGRPALKRAIAGPYRTARMARSIGR